eukprot:TRINITY_DN1208_c0_g1_i1.p1 TRINITY_DN1208_c0_g1~~TRINITY_DN1208_c0_g1_i1.p1  ORF type:complete len:204 (+),score=55.75 TRINITY_DN1208_c0_g1_i1:2-613(+)
MAASILLMQTADFAAIAHRTQKRKDGSTPYINHPIGVANLLATVGDVSDTETLQAALLHDTVEDTDVTIDDIKAKFGDSVASIVAEVTDDKGLNKHERKQRQIEHAKHISSKAKLVKLADKLYNLTGLLTDLPQNWSVARARAYYGWSSEVIGSCRGTNAGLEAALDKVFEGTMVVQGKEYPCMPDDYQPGDWKKETPVKDIE